MTTTTAAAKKTARRTTATPASIEKVTRQAAVAEISHALVDRVYGVSQKEMARVLELQASMARDKVELEMLEGKVLLALQNGAAFQPGPHSAELEYGKPRATVAWMGIVEEHLGKEYAAAKRLEAQQAVLGKKGEPKVRIFKK